VNRALWGVLFSVILLPHAVAAEGITRRGGFLLLWQSIQRPAFAVSEAPYADVLEGDSGFLEIIYAKNRGILDDGLSFQPDAPLLWEDALLWLYRTRNVADLDAMQRTDLPKLIERYAIVEQGKDLTLPLVSRDALLSLAHSLDQQLREEVHEVSLYAEDFHGDGTAFGEAFDMHALTAAHRTFPYNTLVRVTNVENEQSVIVRINDRGPFVSGRDMDLSLAAFTTIAERNRGVIRARFERLGDVSLAEESRESTGDDRACRMDPPPRFQKRITRDVRFHRGLPWRWPVGTTLTLRANRWFVVREIVFPDGTRKRVQDWVSPEDRFAFLPVEEGEYHFLFSTAHGKRREMRMEVIACLAVHSP
jgi:rare lipoprotein A